MKLGTLIMKIGMGKALDHAISIPIGAIGEVKPNWPANDMLKNHIVVYFPAYPSWGIDKCWQGHKNLFIALNDPDMDVTENEEETLEDFV